MKKYVFLIVLFLILGCTKKQQIEEQQTTIAHLKLEKGVWSSYLYDNKRITVKYLGKEQIGDVFAEGFEIVGPFNSKTVPIQFWIDRYGNFIKCAVRINYMVYCLDCNQLPDYVKIFNVIKTKEMINKTIPCQFQDFECGFVVYKNQKFWLSQETPFYILKWEYKDKQLVLMGNNLYGINREISRVSLENCAWYREI